MTIQNMKIIGKYYLGKYYFYSRLLHKRIFCIEGYDYEVIEIYKTKNKDEIKVDLYYIELYDEIMYNDSQGHIYSDVFSEIININDLYKKSNDIYSDICKITISQKYLEESDLIEKKLPKDLKSIIVEYMGIPPNIRTESSFSGTTYFRFLTDLEDEQEEESIYKIITNNKKFNLLS